MCETRTKGKLSDEVIKDKYKPIAQNIFAPGDIEFTIQGQKVGQAGRQREIAKEIIKKAKTPEHDDPCCFPRIVLIGYSWGGNTASKVLSYIEQFDPGVSVDLVFTIDPVVGVPLAHGSFFPPAPGATQVIPTSFCKWQSYFQRTARPPFVAYHGDTMRPASNDEKTKADFNVEFKRRFGIQPQWNGHVLIPHFKSIQSDWHRDLLDFINSGLTKDSPSFCGVSDVCP